MTVDFAVTNHGSVWMFHPHTPAALDHAHEAFPEETPVWGCSYAVESRYAPPIVVDLLDLGFAVTLDGESVSLPGE